jgi:hypothetical protein
MDVINAHDSRAWRIGRSSRVGCLFRASAPQCSVWSMRRAPQKSEASKRKVTIKFLSTYPIQLMIKKLICVVALVGFLSGCSHWKSYGTWTFNPEPSSPPSQFGPTFVPVGIDFNFDPSKGDPPVPNCQCDRIVFIQITRTSNPDVPPAGTFKDRFSIAPDDEYFIRQTESGFSIDITAGRKLGYYGLQDDGTPATSTIVIPGNNGPSPVTARLHDTPDFLSTIRGANFPGGPPHELLFEAVDAAVCVEGDAACKNKVLGTFYWRIHSDKNNKILEVSSVSNDDYFVVIQQAIAAWNAHLLEGTTHKTALPAFTYLGH